MSTLKFIVPVVVLIAGGVTAWELVASQDAAKSPQAVREPPLVEVVSAQAESLPITVRSQGVVRPRSEIELVVEVNGTIVRVHPAFVTGGAFQRGEVLVSLDPRDYDQAIVQAQAAVSAAERELIQEQAENQAAREEWKALGEGTADDLTLRLPQLKEKRDQLAGARAALAGAKLKRARCDLHAPFAGLVRDKAADIGQYVSEGTKLARLYPADSAEVRLPLGADQLEFLDLPLIADRGAARVEGPTVVLSARLAGKPARWPARIVRMEGALDEQTGMFYAVAEVRNPYRVSADHVPLPVGLFVQAEIQGHPVANALRLPAAAVREGHHVLVVDASQTVHVREIEVLHNSPEAMLVRGELVPGERVLIAGAEAPLPGTKVRPKDSAPSERAVRAEAPAP